MAFSKSVALLASLLVLLPMATFAADWPAFSPSIAKTICDQVVCGKGTCSFNTSQPLGYTCECDAGWKRTAKGNDDYKFLPCVIPNCTLEYNGCQAPPNVIDPTQVPHSFTTFDPCSWVYCGEGTCVTNSTYFYSPECKCDAGASNLLGVTVFPCYKECTLQPNCASLGIKVSNATASTNGTNDSSKAIDFMPGKFQLMTVVMVAVGMLL